jgi:hypothetical protein
MLYRFYNFIIKHAVTATIICLTISLVIPPTIPELGPVSAIFWKLGGVSLGAWVGNIIYIKYFCDGLPVEECTTPDVHRLYFILGICAVFAIR